MKIRSLTLVLALLLPILTFSQSVELIPFGGWQFGGNLNLRYGEAKFKASGNFGGAISIVMPNDVAIQFEYFQQPTTINYREYYPSTDFANYSAKIDWYQIGGLRQIDVNDQVAGFGGITLGAANLRVPEATNSVNEWAFALTGQIGAKLYLSDRIGLMVRARFLMPVQWGGFGFYFGSGGSGSTVNVGSYLAQGDLGGGLIIRLGN